LSAVGKKAAHTFRRARWGITLAPLMLVLAGCGTGSGGSGAGSPPSANGSLKNADSTVQSAMKSYLAGVGGCAKQSSPVVCLEAADHKLGNQIHTYANLLAVGRGFTAPQTDISTTRDAAQTLANNLEILGDAQPTQANYDQVLNTFDVHSAITRLHSDVANLGGSLGR
jgi:hypothetical protein